MKRLLSLLIAAAAVVCSHAEFRVIVPQSSHFDEIVVTSRPLSELAGNAQALTYDTIRAGSEMLFQPVVPMVYTLNPAYADYNRVDIYTAPDESVSITIDNAELAQSTVTGSEIMNAIAAYRRELKQFESDSLTSIGNRDDRIMALYMFKMRYALAHRNEPVAIIAISGTPVQMAASVIDSIGSDTANSLLAPVYQHIVANIAKQKALTEAKNSTSSGKQAPDFTLPDSQGTLHKLSDYRGSWVLIDFWGTWCGWCLKGFPAMREFHNANADSCKIITVDGHDSEDNWKAYIESHDMPWINLINDPTQSSGNAMKIYGVESFPTKILIDPDGIVRLRAEGEQPGFYDTVTQILNSKN